MNVFCPYCTKPIKPAEEQCVSCGRVFGEETRKFLQAAVQEGLQRCPDDQRRYPRFPKTFKITFASQDALRKYYLSDISPGGLFIKTNDPLQQGEVFKLNMFLPGVEEVSEVLCEVVWAHAEQWVSAGETFSPGMGVRFVEPPKETVDRILASLNGSSG